MLLPHQFLDGKYSSTYRATTAQVINCFTSERIDIKSYHYKTNQYNAAFLFILLYHYNVKREKTHRLSAVQRRRAQRGLTGSNALMSHELRRGVFSARCAGGENDHKQHLNAHCNDRAATAPSSVSRVQSSVLFAQRHSPNLRRLAPGARLALGVEECSTSSPNTVVQLCFRCS